MPPFGSLTGLDWLAQNSLRRFPLADDSSTKDTTDTFTLPDDLIVDFILPVSTAINYDPDGFLLREVAVFGQGVVLTFAYTADNVTFSEVGRVSVSASHKPNTSYFLNGTGSFFDSVGRVTIGRLDSVMELAGSFTFDLNGGRLVSTTIRPDVRGVSSLRVRNGSDLSDPIYGDVELVAGANISLQAVDESTIRINAVSGENLNIDCGCLTTADRSTAPCVRTINGVTANSQGDIQVVGFDCLSIESGQNSIVFKDACAQPCCTNNDISRVTEDLSRLISDVRTQGFTMSQFETRLINLHSLADAIAATGFIVT